MIFRAELLKAKRNAFLFFIFILPAIIVSLFFFRFYGFTLQEYIDSLYGSKDTNPWYNFYKFLLLVLAFILPLVASIITFVVKNIEDKANGWKILFVLPEANIKLYLYKFMMITVILLFYQASAGLLIVAASSLLARLKPEFEFTLYNSHFDFLSVYFFEQFLIALAVASFTYCYLIYLKKTIAGLLLSIFLPVVGLFFSYAFNIYYMAIDVTFSIQTSRALFFRNANPADNYVFPIPSDFTVYAYPLLWIILAWVCIYRKSKSPTINYY